MPSTNQSISSYPNKSFAAINFPIQTSTTAHERRN